MKGYDPEVHHRRSIRLKGYDYAEAGAYFVTVCAHDRQGLFGDIEDGIMRLNRFGEIVRQTWAWLGERYPYAELDVWVVMPNHVHGIIVIRDDDCRGGSRTAPTGTMVTGTPGIGQGRGLGGSRTAPTVTSGANRKPLGRFIGAFKTVSTKHVNELRGTAGVGLWQRNYYEHIIRNEDELERIREYIATNPVQWETDRENPARREINAVEEWLYGKGGRDGSRSSRGGSRTTPTGG